MQAPGSPVVPPTTLSNVGATQFYGVTPLPSSATTYTAPYQFSGSAVAPSGRSEKEHSFPERPGQPECQYYMKTGDCKLGPSCRYHHPPELLAAKMNVVLNPVGLPSRPVTIIFQLVLGYELVIPSSAAGYKFKKFIKHMKSYREYNVF